VRVISCWRLEGSHFDSGNCDHEFKMLTVSHTSPQNRRLEYSTVRLTTAAAEQVLAPALGHKTAFFELAGAGAYH